MSRKETKPIDWVHLPEGTEIRYLWDALHDGEIRSCTSNLADQSIELLIHIEHFEDLSDDLDFHFKLSGVKSARASFYLNPPGEFVEQKWMTRAQREKALDEYSAKWREESLGWSEFEAAISEGWFDIQDAELAATELEMALKLSGNLEGDRFDHKYGSVIIAFNRLKIWTASKKDLSLDEFASSGEAYWEAFAERSRQRRLKDRSK